MSDSFADLWNSPTPPNTAPLQTLGAAKSQTFIPKRQHDAFSILSASQPSTRSHSPKVVSPATHSRNPIPPPSARNDAFSDLFSGSLIDGRGHATANMTIAERAAAAQKAKLQQSQAHHTTSPPLPSAWDGLDTLARSSTASHPLPSQSTPENIDFSAFASPTTSTSKSPAERDDWGLPDFATPQPQSVSQAKPTQTLWDMSDFDSPSPSDPPVLPHSRSHGDLDFGDREDGLLESHADDVNDDILGDLGRPLDVVKTSPRNHSNRPTPSPQVPQSHRPASRPVSPPPHIVGQIVEMGFSPQQARIALAATDTGIDVQAALETLLANGAGDIPTPPPSLYDRDYESRLPPRRPPNQRVSSSRDREPPRGREREVSQTQELNVQADKIISQASEIGITVLNRANAFWKESKEKAQRMYEERANASRATAARGDGRPRWISEEGLAPERRDRKVTEVFKDDDESPPMVRPARRQEGKRGQPSSQFIETPSQAQPNEVDLFSSETPEIYQSLYQRGRPIPQPQPPIASHRSPPAPLKPQRLSVPASSAALSTSASHKAKGTSAYKLGQFADAESAYSLAIAALPASHTLLIPLYNNRALTRLKTGDIRGAIDDCTSVIEMVGGDRGVFEEVDLQDALVKAWRRRAEAREGRERWEEAGKDWESVAGAEWAPPNVRGEGVRGVGRCKLMLNSNAEEAHPAPRPMPKPKVPSTKPTPIPANSEALDALRAATNAAEAEENERYELKDSVDARLTTWKGGKETNIRALIASLDTILWPELGWQKVGMHELVSNAQVKSRYTRAIARLHPDKLNARNTTVEHRMIANGVFGALNEAWNAFQQ